MWLARVELLFVLVVALVVLLPQAFVVLEPLLVVLIFAEQPFEPQSVDCRFEQHPPLPQLVSFVVFFFLPNIESPFM